MSVFELDAKSVDTLVTAIKAYGAGAEKKITEYLHGKGYDVLSSSIQNAIPVSDDLSKHGKNQPKGHARMMQALRDRDKGSNLAVIIGTKSRWNYLYFPDDGSNTVHHAGNQQFFQTGVERKENEVINDLLDVLNFEMEE